jgi:hypothetical protein
MWHYPSKNVKENAMPTPVQPKTAYSRVFVFNISKGLVEYRGDEYEATRQAWIRCPLMDLGRGVAVGLKDGISQGVYSFDYWEDWPDNRMGEALRFMFTTERRYDAQSKKDHEFLNKDWSEIIGAKGARGFWQRGSYLVVEFDGRGSIRFLYGCSNKAWRNL